MKRNAGRPEYGTPVVIPLTRMGRGQGQGNPCSNGTNATGNCAPTGLAATGTCAGGGNAHTPVCNTGTTGSTLPGVSG